VRRLAVLAALLLAVAVALLARRGAEREREDEALAEQLGALGYVAHVSDDPDPARKGVSLHDPSRAQPGINVYCSVHSTEVRFLDMQGNVLHRIILPEPGEGADCLLEPYADGSFLALTWPNLAKIDWDSKVAWVSREGHHHDVAVGADGDIYTLSERPRVLRSGAVELPIRDHAVVVLDASGRVRREVGLSRFFRGRIPSRRLERLFRLHGSGNPRPRLYRRLSDVYHPNTVEVLDREVAGGKAGDLLVCVRELDLVAILDLEREAVVWSWGPGALDRPHHPSVLPNGNLLIFDNGLRRGWSRVIELEPSTSRIVWSYRTDPPESFFTSIRGSLQALPNGNVLITESAKGRVFEVTREGQVVWEFWNPDVGEDGRRLQIYRMVRLDPERLGLLGGADGAGAASAGS
jgi:hypothetical protein